MNRRTTLLIDCDNTLVASEDPAFEACCTLVNEVLSDNGVDRRFTADELKSEFVGCNFRSMILRLGEQHGFSLADDELESLVTEEEDRVIAALADTVEPADGANEALIGLETGYRLAVVSSSALRRVRVCLKTAGQERFFAHDDVFSAKDSLPEPTSKPAPDVYIFALDTLAVEADECVAVEDSTSGVLSAKAAGIAVVGYVGCLPEHERANAARTLEEAGADVVVESWEEIAAAVDSLPVGAAS